MTTDRRPFRGRVLASTLVVLTLAAPACSSRLTRTLHAPDAIPDSVSASGPLKGHLRDGGVLVFDAWRFDEASRRVLGTGVRLDPARVESARGAIEVPLDSVALFETNVATRRLHPAVAAVTLVVGAIAIACLTDPKACFGSCPTFYLDDGRQWNLVSESFSSSILPALEATDVDALPGVRPRDGVVELRMTNEAQETHVVRSVDLLCLARPADGGAWSSTAGGFVTTGPAVVPRLARGAEGDCLGLIAELDGRERTSPVDSTDLAATETIDLEFAAAPEGELALVLSARQSLLTTYLIYQGLAWLGTQAGPWLAGIERRGRSARAPFRGLQTTLGSLHVDVVQEGAAAWSADRVPFETGPIAVDTRLVPLGRAASRPGQPIRMRLTLTRGYTRLDQVRLAGVRAPVEPTRLRPFAVLRRGVPDPSALEDLLDSTRVLVTLPGDTCVLRYRLPPALAAAGNDAAWFLEGRGYYLEWIRQSWLAEEDPNRTLQLLLAPRTTLRVLAPEYARNEAAREALFWSSRYGSPRP